MEAVKEIENLHNLNKNVFCSLVSLVLLPKESTAVFGAFACPFILPDAAPKLPFFRPALVLGKTVKKPSSVCRRYIRSFFLCRPLSELLLFWWAEFDTVSFFQGHLWFKLLNCVLSQLRHSSEKGISGFINQCKISADIKVILSTCNIIIILFWMLSSACIGALARGCQFPLLSSSLNPPWQPLPLGALRLHGAEYWPCCPKDKYQAAKDSAVPQSPWNYSRWPIHREPEKPS